MHRQRRIQPLKGGTQQTKAEPLIRSTFQRLNSLVKLGTLLLSTKIGRYRILRSTMIRVQPLIVAEDGVGLGLFDDLLEAMVIDAEDDAAEHLDEAAVAVPGEAFVARGGERTPIIT